MKVCLAFCCMCFTIISGFSQGILTLCYRQRATAWTEALPIGNGRLGAMVFGGVADELIPLNVATLWSGGPVKNNINPTTIDNLQK